MLPERQRKTGLVPEMVQAYAATYIPRFDRYPIQKPDGNYLALEHPLILAIVQGHLTGRITIGADTRNEQSQAARFCFDADQGDDWRSLITGPDSNPRSDFVECAGIKKPTVTQWTCHIEHFLCSFGADRLGYSINYILLTPQNDYRVALWLLISPMQANASGVSGVLMIG